MYDLVFCADFFHHQRTQGIAQYGLQNTHKLVKFIHLFLHIYNIIDIPAKLCEELAENLQSFDRPRRRLLELMLKSTKSKFTTSERNLIFEFFTQPEKIHLDETGRVSGLEIFNTRTNKRITCRKH